MNSCQRVLDAWTVPTRMLQSWLGEPWNEFVATIVDGIKKCKANEFYICAGEAVVEI